MSATEEADGEGSIEVEEITEDTLLPVRIKKNGRNCGVGDDDIALTKDSGFTKAVVYATVGSIMRCPAIQNRDQNVLAEELGDEWLEFKSYSEEAESQHGRSPLQMVMEEGIEAYEDLNERLGENPYLEAALYEVPVAEAADELDKEPVLAVETEAGVKKMGGGFGDPYIVSAAIEQGGEIYEQDLREFVPDLEWVVEHWRTLGGSRHVDHTLRSGDDDEDRLYRLAREQTGPVVDSVINRPERDITLHHIKEIETSPVKGEEDRLVSVCGNDFQFISSLIRLSVDMALTDPGYSWGTCGNCTNWADYELDEDEE